MSQLVSKSYSLAALLIHGAEQEVTTDRIKAIFEVLGLEYSSKVASMFALDRSRYAAMLTSTGSPAPSSAPAGKAAAAEPEVAEKESEESDNVLDF